MQTAPANPQQTGAPAAPEAADADAITVAAARPGLAGIFGRFEWALSCGRSVEEARAVA